MCFRVLSVSLLVVGVCASQARAEQYVLIDLSYTHSSETTSDSHYYPDVPADIPKDWTQPVDYAHGSVHLEVDVKTKPDGGAPTKLQLCFEANAAGCTLQSPTYTSPGHVEWDSPFDSFWFSGPIDWSQGIREMPLILKDDQNNKPAGDPKYMPTELHVLAVLVSAGDTYEPVPSTGASDQGGQGGQFGQGGQSGQGGSDPLAAGGAGMAGRAADAGAGGRPTSAGAGSELTGAGVGGASGPDIGNAVAGVGGLSSAGTRTGARSGSVTTATAGDMPVDSAAASSASAGASAGRTSTEVERTGPSIGGSAESSGCSATGARSGGTLWAWSALVLLGLRRRRRGQEGPVRQ